MRDKKRRRLLLVLAEGRFGNQLLQLAACLTSKEEDERVVLIGFDRIPQNVSFSGTRFLWRNVNRLTATKRAFKLVFLVLRLFPVRKVWFDPKKRVLVRRGRIRTRLSVFADPFMQIGGVLDAQYLHQVYRALKSDNPRVNGSGPYAFCHVRRTDYAHFPSKRFPALLPADYFCGTLAAIRDARPELAVRLYTDDPQWTGAQTCFRDSTLHDESEWQSWVQMCEANAGILSPSSFSLTAAYVAIYRDPGAGPFYAPQFWFGWPQGVWLPPFIEEPGISYRDGRDGSPLKAIDQ